MKKINYFLIMLLLITTKVLAQDTVYTVPLQQNIQGIYSNIVAKNKSTLNKGGSSETSIIWFSGYLPVKDAKTGEKWESQTLFFQANFGLIPIEYQVFSVIFTSNWKKIEIISSSVNLNIGGCQAITLPKKYKDKRIKFVSINSTVYPPELRVEIQ